jgi:uncharacterized protein (DUF1330 family)
MTMRRTALVLSMVACVGAGALGSEALRAQAKPPGYVVVEVDVTDEPNFLKNYSPVAGAVIESEGGQFLARGGRVEAVEGAKPKRMVLLKFDSFEKAVAAFTSKDYRDARTIGDRYGKFRIVALEGRPG